MTEKELIKNIQRLRQIKPEKDWVALTKSQILGEDPNNKRGFELFPFFKPVYAGIFSLLILFGLFEVSRSSLPGDPLYLLKRAVEKTRTVFVSNENKPKLDLELANRRLEELKEIAQTNQVKKLAPAINEFHSDISKAAKNLKKIEVSTSSPEVMKEIVDQTKKLKENKEKVERILATKIETKEYDVALSGLVNNLIRDLEKRTLTHQEEDILKQMKELYNEKKYSQALELYLVNQ